MTLHMDKFKVFNKELLLDINRRAYMYREIDDDFVSSINLLFGDIDFVKAEISKGDVRVYTDTNSQILKQVGDECEEDVYLNKRKYISNSIDRASYSTKLNITIDFSKTNINISPKLKMEVLKELCSYNEQSYSKLSKRYVENLELDLQKLEIFNKDIELSALCNKLSMTYNFGIMADDLQTKANAIKEELSKLDTSETSKVLMNSLETRMEKSYESIER